MLNYAEEAKELATVLKYKKGEAPGFKMDRYVLFLIATPYLKAQDYWDNSLKVYQEANDVLGQSNLLSNMGLIMINLGEKDLAEQYF
jgi:hypothetical protein